ncbi:MAG: ribonuclease III [Ruminococcaceae bacterium]|nr:ribonuclease III [Oscillospiraceae bacterium]MBQ2780445.1 ribonuclease III [Clostridia bacterium]MBQ7302744.1 ribonuclease III [Clostridia bacterium]
MKDLTLLMQRMGYTFQNQALLVNALTHSSYAHEHHRNGKDNERLEFLGDAVLGFVCAEYLFSLLSSQEGELTKVRASVVCEKALASYANTLELGDFLLLGHGEQTSGGNTRPSILSDAFEAVLAAVYLDGGMQAAKAFVMPFLEKEVASQRRRQFKDYKTLLQEIVQQNPGERLSYELVKEAGPDHQKRFTVEVHLNSNVVGTGVGRSKKEAEQQAAREALKWMGYDE